MKKIYISLSTVMLISLFSGCSNQSPTPPVKKVSVKKVSVKKVSVKKVSVKKVSVKKIINPTVDYSSIPRSYLPIYFKFNSYDIDFTQKAKLNYDVDLATCGMVKQVDIIGYADSIGGEVKNYSLALKRANSVAAFLISQGVPEKKIVIKSVGKKFVNCKLNDEKCNSKNRKVEIIEKVKK